MKRTEFEPRIAGVIWPQSVELEKVETVENQTYFTDSPAICNSTVGDNLYFHSIHSIFYIEEMLIEL